MTTPAQAAARASNGRRYSTGPKTEAGKKASRANALRHGIYARTVAVVPFGPLAEDPELYEAFCEGVIDYWQPWGPSEEQIAQSIADLQWRDGRVPLYEASLLANSADAFEWERTSPKTSSVAREAEVAEAMSDLDAVQDMEVLRLAAIGVREHVGVGMFGGWGQPRPETPLEWVRCIDRLLDDHGSSREAAARAMAAKAAWSRAVEARYAAQRFSQTVAEAVGQEQLVALMRAEAHLGRQRARKIQLLRQMQEERRSAGTGDEEGVDQPDGERLKRETKLPTLTCENGTATFPDRAHHVPNAL